MKTTQIKTENVISKMIPILLVFFTMGFIDMVGTAINYMKIDFSLADKTANAFSLMVYLWFLIFSIPTGMLMNKIGRKKTVLISLVVTFVGLCIPIISYTTLSMILCFSFLGIGNTLMQVSLNPLITNIVSGNKLPSYLTLGQFIKAIASFMAPIIAAEAMILYSNWRLLFVLFAGVTVIATIYLLFTNIREQPIEGKPSTFKECFGLLGDKIIIILFLGILVHVGIDVGINITAPKLLTERADMILSDALYATSFYFLFRTLGCFAGTFILAKFSSVKFFIISVCIMLIGILGLYFSNDKTTIYICVAMIGFGNSNIFPIILSRALQYMPARGNEISGLMIMGIAGGGIFSYLMGVASDGMGGQIGAVVILTLCIAYLVFLMFRIGAINMK